MKRGSHHTKETIRKMKGRSNFEGHKHKKETIEKMSKSATKRMEDPKVRENLSKKLSSIILEKYAFDPDYKKTHDDALAKFNEEYWTEERIKEWSERTIRLWLTEWYRKKTLKAMRKRI